MKRMLLTFIVLLTVLGCDTAGNSACNCYGENGLGPNDYSILIKNQTGYDIHHLYVSHESADNWGRDFLEGAILSSGAMVRYDLVGYKSQFFDVHAIDEDGDTYTAWGLDVSREDLTLTLAYLDVRPTY